MIRLSNNSSLHKNKYARNCYNNYVKNVKNVERLSDQHNLMVTVKRKTTN